MQKPFAPTFEDAAAIVAAAEAAGVWLAVHENFRYAAPMRNLARIVASGAIGTPNWARIAFRTHYDVYRTQPYLYDEERFVIADVGIHVLDLARFLLGEVARLSCETQRRNPKVRAEDTATMLLRHESGATSVVDCSYAARRSPDPFPETMVEIEGDRGSIVDPARMPGAGDLGEPRLGGGHRGAAAAVDDPAVARRARRAPSAPAGTSSPPSAPACRRRRAARTTSAPSPSSTPPIAPRRPERRWCRAGTPRPRALRARCRALLHFADLGYTNPRAPACPRQAR